MGTVMQSFPVGFEASSPSCSGSGTKCTKGHQNQKCDVNIEGNRSSTSRQPRHVEREDKQLCYCMMKHSIRRGILHLKVDPKTYPLFDSTHKLLLLHSIHAPREGNRAVATLPHIQEQRAPDHDHNAENGQPRAVRRVSSPLIDEQEQSCHAGNH